MKKELFGRASFRFLGTRRWMNVLGGTLGAIAVIGVALFIWQRANAPIGQGDYDGTIVDRWADHSGSPSRPGPFFHLGVESQDGKRFTVKVDPNVYESARVGMRIRSRSGQVVLIEPAPDSW